MAEEGGRAGGGEQVGKLIIGSSSDSGEGDRTWAREVPEFQKNGVESIGHAELAVSVRERELSRKNPRFSGLNIWLSAEMGRLEQQGKIA